MLGENHKQIELRINLITNQKKFIGFKSKIEAIVNDYNKDTDFEGRMSYEESENIFQSIKKKGAEK